MISNILKKHGIEPAPGRSRKTTWKEFLTQQWELIVAEDFFTVEVWTRRGLQRFLVLFFIELSSRRVKIAGIGAQANDAVRLTQLGARFSCSIGVRKLEFCGGCFEAGGGADIAPIESIGTKRKDSFVCGGEKQISGDD